MTAYHLGFCDCCDGVYCNRYRPGTQAWRKYAQGFADAKHAARLAH